MIVYNPLDGGFLSGKYKPGQQPVNGTRFTLAINSTAIACNG